MFVAHSISSFIAQKYLESYSLKGLVLVNPVPPSHTIVVENLLNKYKMSIEKQGIDNNQAIQSYYNLECEVQDTPAFPVQFMENIIADKNAFLRLEKGNKSLLTLLYRLLK